MEFAQQTQQTLQTQYETHSYSADTTRIMELFVRNLYGSKDIWLRELISNSSDAINKAQLIDLKYKIGNKIEISSNSELSQVIIQDTGCGITKTDLINKIGSIGTSGTKQFMETLKESKDKLIGQFGVGFYSIYLISSKIRIITKPIGENKIWEWISESESTYSIRELDADSDSNSDLDFTRGTKIIITLNPDSL